MTPGEALLVDRLDEVQALASRDGTVTEEQWRRVFSARDPRGGPLGPEELARHKQSAQDARKAARRRLDALGLALTYSVEVDEDGRRGLVIRVSSPELLAFVEERLAEARAVLGAEAPDEPDEVELLDAEAVVAAYRNDSDTTLPVFLVAKLFGVGVERVRRVLGPVARRRLGPPLVEERVDPTEARRLALGGAPLWRVAQALRCSWSGARAFAARAWSETRQSARDTIRGPSRPGDAPRHTP